MAEKSPLFLALVRPPKLLGLPIMYAMVWLFGGVLLFVWLQHILVLAIAAILYPFLWKAADWDPRFIDVMITVLQETPHTRKPLCPWRRQLCAIMKPSTMRSTPGR